jgi:CBS domain-containing protein
MPTVKEIERIVKRSGRVLTIPAHASVAQAATVMRENEVGCLVVLNQTGALAGILTERDIITQVVARSRNPAGTVVGEVMAREVICCDRDTSISKAQRIMAEYGIRHLPIVEDGVPVGMISSRDVLAHMLSTAQAVVQRQAEVLRELERQHPGITSLRKDASGRIIF